MCQTQLTVLKAFESQFIQNMTGGIFFANKGKNIVFNGNARCGKAGLEKLEERLLRYMKNIKIP